MLMPNAEIYIWSSGSQADPCVPNANLSFEFVLQYPYSCFWVLRWTHWSVRDFQMVNLLKVIKSLILSLLKSFSPLSPMHYAICVVCLLYFILIINDTIFFFFFSPLFFESLSIQLSWFSGRKKRWRLFMHDLIPIPMWSWWQLLGTDLGQTYV